MRLHFFGNFLRGSPLKEYYCSALDLKIQFEPILPTRRDFHSQGDISILSITENTAFSMISDSLISREQTTANDNELNNLSNTINKTPYMQNLIELCKGKNGTKSSFRTINIPKLYREREDIDIDRFDFYSLLGNNFRGTEITGSKLVESNRLFSKTLNKMQKDIRQEDYKNLRASIIDKCHQYTTAVTITCTNAAIATTSVTTTTNRTVPFYSRSISKLESDNNECMNNSTSGSNSDCSSSSSSSSSNSSSSSSSSSCSSTSSSNGSNSGSNHRKNSSYSNDSCRNSNDKYYNNSNNNKKSIKNIQAYKDDDNYHHNNNKIVGSSQTISHLSHDLDLIPDPDYSISESDNEETEDIINTCKSGVVEDVTNTIYVEKRTFTEEISDNFNTISVKFLNDESSQFSTEIEEQYNSKTLFKSKTIYPKKLVKDQSSKIKKNVNNISSNFCSDQNALIKDLIRIDDSTKIINNEDSTKNDHHLEKLTRINSIFSKYDVDFFQLPPPIDVDIEDHYNNLFVPPPPEFNVSKAFSNKDSDIVLPLPPPQFRDSKQFHQNLVKSNELLS